MNALEKILKREGALVLFIKKLQLRTPA